MHKISNSSVLAGISIPGVFFAWVLTILATAVLVASDAPGGVTALVLGALGVCIVLLTTGPIHALRAPDRPAGQRGAAPVHDPPPSAATSPPAEDATTTDLGSASLTERMAELEKELSLTRAAADTARRAADSAREVAVAARDEARKAGQEGASVAWLEPTGRSRRLVSRGNVPVLGQQGYVSLRSVGDPHRGVSVLHLPSLASGIGIETLPLTEQGLEHVLGQVAIILLYGDYTSGQGLLHSGARFEEGLVDHLNRGYVDPSEAGRIPQLLLGEAVWSLREEPSLVGHIRSFMDESLVTARGRAKRSPLNEMTAREREVLSEIAQGKSNTAIAETLFLTKRAVEKHINSIFLKLGLADAEDVSKRVKAALMFLSDADSIDAGNRVR